VTNLGCAQLIQWVIPKHMVNRRSNFFERRGTKCFDLSQHETLYTVCYLTITFGMITRVFMRKRLAASILPICAVLWFALSSDVFGIVKGIVGSPNAQRDRPTASLGQYVTDEELTSAIETVVQELDGGFKWANLELDPDNEILINDDRFYQTPVFGWVTRIIRKAANVEHSFLEGNFWVRDKETNVLYEVSCVLLPHENEENDTSRKVGIYNFHFWDEDGERVRKVNNIPTNNFLFIVSLKD